MRYPSRRNPESLRQSVIKKLRSLEAALQDLESPVEAVLSEISEVSSSLESLHAELLASMPLDFQGFLEFIRDDPGGRHTDVYRDLEGHTEGRMPNADDLAEMLTGAGFASSITNRIKRLSDYIKGYLKNNHQNYDRAYLTYLLENLEFLVKITNTFHPLREPLEFSEIEPGDRYNPNTMTAFPSDVVSGNVEYVYAQGLPRIRLNAIVRVKK